MEFRPLGLSAFEAAQTEFAQSSRSLNSWLCCAEVVTLLHDLGLNRIQNISMFESKSQQFIQPLVVPDCRLSVIATLDNNRWIGNPWSEPWWRQQVRHFLNPLLKAQTYAHSLSLLQKLLLIGCVYCGQQLQLCHLDSGPEEDWSVTCGREKLGQYNQHNRLGSRTKCSSSKTREIHYFPEFSVPPSLRMYSDDIEVQGPFCWCQYSPFHE